MRLLSGVSPYIKISVNQFENGYRALWEVILYFFFKKKNKTTCLCTLFVEISRKNKWLGAECHRQSEETSELMLCWFWSFHGFC